MPTDVLPATALRTVKQNTTLSSSYIYYVPSLGIFLWFIECARSFLCRSFPRRFFPARSLPRRSFPR